MHQTYNKCAKTSVVISNHTMYRYEQVISWSQSQWIEWM